MELCNHFLSVDDPAAHCARSPGIIPVPITAAAFPHVRIFSPCVFLRASSILRDAAAAITFFPADRPSRPSSQLEKFLDLYY